MKNIAKSIDYIAIACYHLTIKTKQQRPTGMLQSLKALQTDIVDTRKGKQLGFDKTLHSNIINQFHFPSNREHKEREVNKAKATIP